jgi:hypothetical protein
MPTNVTNFGGVYYATAYRLHGGRVVVLGTHRSDLPGVRAWLTDTGFSLSGAYLAPTSGTPPGFFVKPYAADVYYRIDPTTRAAEWDGTTRFGEPVTVTERDGFQG